MPDRLWTSASFHGESLHVSGRGKVDVGATFTISANGILTEVVVVDASWSSDLDTDRGGYWWHATDRGTFESRYRTHLPQLVQHGPELG
jgi:hypothetical protein